MNLQRAHLRTHIAHTRTHALTVGSLLEFLRDFYTPQWSKLSQGVLQIKFQNGAFGALLL